jgi:glucokinase
MSGETPVPASSAGPDGGYAIGIDIGGTKVAGGLVDVGGRISHRVRRDTPQDDPAGVEATVLSVARELASEPGVVAVGVGAPGVVDETGSVVRFAANLGWREVPLRARLQDATGLPTTVENDTNSACWGEVRFGAAVGEDDVAFVGLGTGIGGGIVLGGELYRGHSGMASEFGHVRVVPDGRPCGCGRRGCWEQYASGTALVREARERARDLPEAARGLLALGDGTPEGLDGPLLTRAAAAGDPLALSCFTEVGRWLGQGIADIVASFDPGVVVVGGGVSEAGDLLLASARTAFAAALFGVEHRPVPDLRVAALGNDAGLVGAADLGRRVTLGSP